MKFTFNHYNFNVIDLEKSIKFYKENLKLNEIRRKNASDGSYIIVFLSDDESNFSLELTWLRDWEKDSYNLGDEEAHLAFRVDDFDGAYDLHKKNDCICYENKKMGIYFLKDPDGYWIEIIPTRK